MGNPLAPVLTNIFFFIFIKELIYSISVESCKKEKSLENFLDDAFALLDSEKHASFRFIPNIHINSSLRVGKQLMVNLYNQAHIR